MKFTREQIFEGCKKIAPKYNLDPIFILAICTKECYHDKQNNYVADIGRPETNYFFRYVEKKYNLATTSELLLSCSYGVMQCMGDALYDLKFFDFYFNQCSDGMKSFLKSPLSEFAVPSALDNLVENLDWMIEFGCKWFTVKLRLADPTMKNLKRGLDFWNGDLTGKYSSGVLEIYESLKTQLK